MAKKSRRTIPYTDYYKYLQSPEWRLLKIKYLNSKLPKKCEACHAQYKKGFHFHHRSYKNLGNEYLRDLVILCPACHQELHDFHEYSGKPLWNTTTIFCRRKRKSLGIS